MHLWEIVYSKSYGLDLSIFKALYLENRQRLGVNGASTGNHIDYSNLDGHESDKVA